MIAANVNGSYNEITQVFAGGDVQQEIIKIWASAESKWVYEAIGELSGALPLTFHADGTPLIHYKIYGNYSTSGIGTPTKNLFNKSAIESPAYIRANGTINTTSGATGYAISDYIPVSAGDYVAHGLQSRGNLPHIAVYDENQEFVRAVQIISNEDLNLTIGNDEKYVRLSVRMAGNEYLTAMFTRGATAPENYIPYGYDMKIHCSAGAGIQIIPVYIGNTRLREIEYVSYGEQKIYRFIDGILTSTDPPVPLPALPTCEGMTIVDYDSTPAPSSVEIKYKKGW
jgi:hypothetical protein